MKSMSTRRGILLFVAALIVLLLGLRGCARVAEPLDADGAEQVLEIVRKAGYSLEENNSRSNRFRNHVQDWTSFPTQKTRVTYYDVTLAQPNDTLPQFTMTLIELVFENTGHAFEFVRSFNNSAPSLRNGNEAHQSFNVAYVCTKQLRFSNYLKKVYSLPEITGPDASK